MAEQERGTLIEINPRGDVIFNVGDETPAYKIRVSSAILLLASRAFEGLLGPNFEEGQRLRNANANVPVEIQLPEDEPQATSDLCHLVHLKSLPDVSGLAFEDRVLGLAIAADKYGCVETLQVHMRAFLRDAMEHQFGNGTPWPADRSDEAALCMAKIASAAYLTDQRKVFHDVTKILVASYAGRFMSLRQIGILPIEVLLVLEEMRNSALEYLSSKVAIGAVYLGCRTRSCKETSIDATYLKQICRAFDVWTWPPQYSVLKISLKDSMQKLRSLGKIQLQDSFETFACDHNAVFRKMSTDLSVFANALEERCRGLCLRCAREDAAMLSAPCPTPDEHAMLVR